MNSKLIIFADIDGSLLNSDYEAPDIEPILQKLLGLGVLMVFDSSKTAAEVIYYRKKWGIRDPFIVENGSAIFIPNGYFKQTQKAAKHTADYQIIEYGLPYSVIREILAAAKTRAGIDIRGFGDMTTQELAADCGLPLEQAVLAKQRRYSEPFKVLSGGEDAVLKAVAARGLSVTRGGRYLHAMGDADKGKAALALKKMFLKECGGVFTVAVGDSANDLPLLNVVDKPFWVNQENPRETVWRQIMMLAQTQFSIC